MIIDLYGQEYEFDSASFKNVMNVLKGWEGEDSWEMSTREEMAFDISFLFLEECFELPCTLPIDLEGHHHYDT